MNQISKSKKKTKKTFKHITGVVKRHHNTSPVDKKDLETANNLIS